jgi:hypothetical protein
MAPRTPPADAEAMRRLGTTLLVVCAFGVLAQSAPAAGPAIAFAGGTPGEQATVRSALAASSFDWSLIPHLVTVHVGAYGDSFSTPGDVFLDAQLLDSGRVAWGVVQHEFGHQVDFFLLDDAKRATLLHALGGKDWCYGVQGLAHSDYGCERFASELAWAYWQSPDNSMKPSDCGGESGGMPVAQFRALLAQLIGAPTAASTTEPTKAYAPAVRAKRRR